MSDTTTDQTEPETKPFAEWLVEQRRGATHAELSQALSDIVAAVAETNKAGSLTLTLKIKPAGDGMVQIEDAINEKAPEPDRSASLYFYDDAGNVFREDPRQQKLDLRSVRDEEKVRNLK